MAYTTVETVMERPAEKGYLHCNTQQRAYVYTPTQSRESFLRQVSDAVLSGLLKDFGKTLAVHLLEETVRHTTWKVMSQILDALKIFPFKSTAYENISEKPLCKLLS